MKSLGRPFPSLPADVRERADEKYPRLQLLTIERSKPPTSFPGILAAGAAIMAIAGIVFFHEPASWQRLLGVAFAITGLFLLRR